MKVRNAGLDNAYAIVRGWLGPNAAVNGLASGSIDGSEDGTPVVSGAFGIDAGHGLDETDLGGVIGLAVDESELDLKPYTDAEGAIAIRYTFSTTTTDSDPGAGILRLSNATQYSAVTARCDLLDVAGADVTNALDLIGVQTGSPLGYLRIQKTDDPTKWLLATVSAIASPSGYRNITIANIAKSANSPFADGDPVTVVFVSGTVGLALASAIPAFAIPALTLGTANAAGVASTVIRSDATILVFDATVPAAIGTAAAGAATTAPRRDHVHPTGAGTPSTQAFGDAAATGSGPAAAMTDHKHAMPADPTTGAISPSALTFPGATTPAQTVEGSAVWDTDDDVLTVGDGASRSTFGKLGSTNAAAIGTAAAGTSKEGSRVDHVHPTGAGTPTTAAFSDAAATGSGPAAAMTDHRHGMPASTSSGQQTFSGASLYHNTTAAVNAAPCPLNSELYDTDGYHFTSSAALTGTVAKNGTTAIVGTSTLFTTELSVNQVISIPGTATEVGVVKTITDNTHLTLWAAMVNTASGQTATRRTEFIAIPSGLGGYFHIFGVSDGLTNALRFHKNGNLTSSGGTTISENSGGSGTSFARVPTQADVLLAAGDMIALVYIGNTTIGNASSYEAQTQLMMSRFGT